MGVQCICFGCPRALDLDYSFLWMIRTVSRTVSRTVASGLPPSATEICFCRILFLPSTTLGSQHTSSALSCQYGSCLPKYMSARRQVDHGQFNFLRQHKLHLYADFWPWGKSTKSGTGNARCSIPLYVICLFADA